MKLNAVEDNASGVFYYSTLSLKGSGLPLGERLICLPFAPAFSTLMMMGRADETLNFDVPPLGSCRSSLLVLLVSLLMLTLAIEDR